MASCSNCGANVDVRGPAPVECKFCGAMNAPPPKEVHVPIPVQVVHNVVQVMGESGAAKELRCPDCKKRLVTAKVDDVELSGCAGCGGIWMENASARRVVLKPQRAIAELATRAGRNASAARQARVWDGVPRPRRLCPGCDGGMDETRYGALKLDVCHEHGTWFDPYELKELIESLLRPMPAQIDRDPEVSCAGCKTTLRASQSNVTGNGPMCDTCWRAVQQRLIEEADRDKTTRGAYGFASAVGDLVEHAQREAARKL